MAFNLSLTKKSDAQQAVIPLWHPNFRNFDRLPDTKVVRTTFFVNTAAFAITLVLLLWLGYREYHIFDLGQQIAEAQKQIDDNARPNKEALRLTKIFNDEAKKLAEAKVFNHAAISPTEFVLLLGQNLPKEISIENLDARLVDQGGGAMFQLKGLVAGTPDQASGAASKYVEMLKTQPRLGAVFDPITLTNLSRGGGGSFLTFDISLKIKSDPKEKK